MKEEPKSDQKNVIDPKESLPNIKPFDALEVIKEAVSDNGVEQKNIISIIDD